MKMGWALKGTPAGQACLAACLAAQHASWAARQAAKQFADEDRPRKLPSWPGMAGSDRKRPIAAGSGKPWETVRFALCELPPPQSLPASPTLPHSAHLRASFTHQARGQVSSMPRARSRPSLDPSKAWTSMSYHWQSCGFRYVNLKMPSLLCSDQSLPEGGLWTKPLKTYFWKCIGLYLGIVG